jgi:large subunit ribosomal protein L9
MASSVKVLLRKNVDSLGLGGEVVRVKPGFARNYLLPAGLAVPATAGNLARVAELKRLAAQQAEEELAVAKEMGVKLGAMSVEIERASGEEDRMWGSVTARDIEEAFERVGVKLDRKRIQLAEPIKTFGPVEVPIRLHQSLVASLKVEVKKKK